MAKVDTDGYLIVAAAASQVDEAAIDFSKLNELHCNREHTVGRIVRSGARMNFHFY